LLGIRGADHSDAISLSVTLKRPERSFGGTTASRASSFTDGSTRVYRLCAAVHKRYVAVTQQDLQREFHQARQNAVHPHRMPTLSLPKDIEGADLPAIRRALAATRHLLEMYRRQLSDEKTKRKLERLDRRLLAVASQLDRTDSPEK
jgi:hypothetical protein